MFYITSTLVWKVDIKGSAARTNGSYQAITGEDYIRAYSDTSQKDSETGKGRPSIDGRSQVIVQATTYPFQIIAMATHPVVAEIV